MSGADGRLRFTNPDDVNMTLTLTMPVKHWRQLAETLKGTVFAGNDGWHLTHTVLTDLLAKADKELWAYAAVPE